jgi:Fe-S-cluster-containing dehydrogenase component
MKKYAVVIDVALCENCNNCFLSCKDEHCGNSWPGYSHSQPKHGQRWMDIHRKERGRFPMVQVAYLPKPCMHCDDAPCIKASGDGSVYKREDGIVLIDHEKAKGRKNLVAACPYNAIWWNEDEQVPQKCTLCAHLLDGGWKAPRCIQACPTGALSLRHLDHAEMAMLTTSERLEQLYPEWQKTRPRVYYKNLHLFSSCMIGGSVATTGGTVTECAADVPVRLVKDGETVAEQVTDDFGDFMFDGLEAGGSGYEIAVLHAGQTVTRRVGDLAESRIVETIWI